MKKSTTLIGVILLASLVTIQAQTVMVKDINQGANGSVIYSSVNYENQLFNFNGTLFFTANDGINGIELWKTDGTDAGTVLVKDIYPGPDGSSTANSPSKFANINGTLFFTADDGINGVKLWKTDGTTVGTVLVNNLNFNLDNLVEVSDTFFYFSGGLYKSDGTVAGTSLVSSISGNNLINVNGTLFFTRSGSSGDWELWKSDGTTSGTVLVKSVSSFPILSGNPFYLTNVNGTLFFTAENGTNGRELWKSDGTDMGTVMVKDIRSGSNSSNPFNLTNVNGTLFFSANNVTNGVELWKSDGTNAGTVLVKDINPSGSSNPFFLIDFNDTLFFVAYDGNKDGLWKSDGTNNGTVLVKNFINTTSFVRGLGELVDVDGLLFLYANDGIRGKELWKSDGTTAGTVLVKDIYSGVSDSDPGKLTDVNGTLFFYANNGIHGTELWKSDGVIQVVQSSISDTICDGNSYYFNGKFLTQSGTYNDTIQTVGGYDSIVNLTLTINPSPYSVTIAQICAGESYMFNGTSYTQTGNYVAFLQTTLGCDSTLMLDLTVGNFVTKNLVKTICLGDTFTLNGKKYSQEGTYIDTLTGTVSCDTIVTLNLTISNPTGTDNQTACGSYTWINGNTYTTNNNTATYTIAGGSVNGCDSVVTLNLTINSFDISVSQSGTVLTANENGANYQWLNCNNNYAVINNATSQSFTATATGNYAAKITANGCSDTSACFNVTVVGMEDITHPIFVRLYPNPNNGTFVIELSDDAPHEVVITDILGKVVQSQKQIVKTQQFSLNNAAGVFFMRIIGEKQLNPITLRLVVE